MTTKSKVPEIAGGETGTIHKPELCSLPRLAYSMREVAKMLGVSYITVHRLVQRGLLRSSNALRHKLIPLSEVEKFLKTTTK